MDGDAFSYITPKALRKNIVESVEFAGWLWIASQTIENKYTDEIARTIILYNIAIVEALLLFRAKKQKIKFYREKCKKPSNLPREFQNKNSNIGLAFKVKTEKPESQ